MAGPGEPGRGLVRAVIFLVALVAVPVLVGVATWTIVSGVIVDDDGDPGAAPPSSTIPEAQTATVAVPGAPVTIPGTGSDPGVPGVPGAPAPSAPGLPPGWPEALTPPAGSTILSSVANGGTLVLSYGSDQEAAALADQLRLQLASGGFAVTNEFRAPDGASASMQGESPTQRAVVSVAPSPNPGQPPRLVNVILNAR